MNYSLISAPTHIWIGAEQQLQKTIYQKSQELFCPQVCNICTTCISIRTRQHHAFKWFTPEKYYTRALIEKIFHTISFSLNTREHHFFILEHAHLLTSAVGNSLLKSLEEPPQGYHFILLCERLDTLLPTIISRGLIYNFDNPLTAIDNELFILLKEPLQIDYYIFNKMLEKNLPTESKIPFLLDMLLHYWTENLHYNLLHKETKKMVEYSHFLNILTHVKDFLPMPGSAKFFLRNLFIALITKK
jgi:hypothetical protein